jgi:hypothetical protein
MAKKSKVKIDFYELRDNLKVPQICGNCGNASSPLTPGYTLKISRAKMKNHNQKLTRSSYIQVPLCDQCQQLSQQNQKAREEFKKSTIYKSLSWGMGVGGLLLVVGSILPAIWPNIAMGTFIGVALLGLVLLVGSFFARGIAADKQANKRANYEQAFDYGDTTQFPSRDFARKFAEINGFRFIG